MSYSEKLASPKWQRKRLEVMQRDGFQCQCCLSKENELTVHHKWYESNTKPWDYPDTCFVTLCKNCHEIYHNLYDGKQVQLTGLTNTDYFIISTHFMQSIKLNGYNAVKMIKSLLLSMIITENDL